MAIALVATCAHLFNLAGSQGHIRLTLFDGPSERDLNGEVLAFDLERDVALIRTEGVGGIEPVPLASRDSVSVGDPILVAGCDYAHPTKTWTAQLTAIDRSYGAPTIGVSEMPRHGRSGGPAVSANGELIGICNAKNTLHNEGVYASVASLRDQLRRIGDWRTSKAMTPAPPTRAGRGVAIRRELSRGQLSTGSAVRSVALSVPDAKPAQPARVADMRTNSKAR